MGLRSGGVLADDKDGISQPAHAPAIGSSLDGLRLAAQATVCGGVRRPPDRDQSRDRLAAGAPARFAPALDRCRPNAWPKVATGSYLSKLNQMKRSGLMLDGVTRSGRIPQRNLKFCAIHQAVRSRALSSRDISPNTCPNTQNFPVKWMPLRDAS
jgi:hypothetical protein